MDPGRHHHRGHERADAGEEGKYREAPTPEFSLPDPCQRARELVEESRRLLAQALADVQERQDMAQASRLVGRASDHIGSALHFIRLELRRH